MALNYLTSAVVMLEGIFFIGLVQQMVFGPKRYDTQQQHNLCYARSLPHQTCALPSRQHELLNMNIGLSTAVQETVYQ